MADSHIHNDSDSHKQDVKRDAYISDCGRYRYLLTRQFNDPNKGLSETHIHAMGFGVPVRQIVFVMLNPSTADAYEDDPTIRRCMGFARREGFDIMHVANLYAGRATKPKDLFRMEDPCGPENQRVLGVIKNKSEEYTTIVCAWGSNKDAQKQSEQFLEFMGDRQLHCLGDTTKNGSPRHPLYLKSDTPLNVFARQSLSKEQSNG